jgi:hypothetical protein
MCASSFVLALLMMPLKFKDYPRCTFRSADSSHSTSCRCIAVACRTRVGGTLLYTPVKFPRLNKLRSGVSESLRYPHKQRPPVRKCELRHRFHLVLGFISVVICPKSPVYRQALTFCEFSSRTCTGVLAATSVVRRAISESIWVCWRSG